MKLHEIIAALAAESSTKAKSAILQKYKDNFDLKLYFKATLDPFINYWIRISDVPESTGNEFNHLDATTIQQVINNLNGRVFTGHAARDYVYDVMLSLNQEDKILLKNMINRDANCKVAEGLVNKCWKKLIPEFPVMLADKYDEKTAKNIPEGKDKIIVQKKEDGGRVAIVVLPDSSVTVYSRNGNVLETHGVFDSHFSQYPGKVFDGELLVLDPNTGKFADRKLSNGIFNKAVRGTITPEEAATLHAVLWDVVPYEKWMDGFDEASYKDRLAELLICALTIPTHRASVVETKVVSTHYECQKFYDDMLEQGFEGAMMKVATMPWEAKRSKFVLKLKETKDATLLCVGVQQHSKYPDQIGSLECKTSCGKLEVSIGSGLTEEDRKRPPEYFVDKLIDIQYNMLITKKNSDKHSMFLPRYRSIRLDQSVADNLEHLQ